MKKLALACLVTFFVVLPIAANACDLSPMERLGEALFKDVNLSINRNQSCQSCHHPSAGFADPDNRWNRFFTPVSEGSKPDNFGGRNAPTAAYSGYSPVMFYDPAEGLFIGGTFWDGRASGLTLGDPLAEQALGPFLNPVEMALPEGEGALRGKAVVDRVLKSSYRSLYKSVCGELSAIGYEEAYNCVGKAIAAYERTNQLVKFSSRFDKFWAERGKDVSTFGTNPETGEYAGVPRGVRSRHLNPLELWGLALFNATDKGNCAACHPTANLDENTPPMFTDFTYDNLGIPVNPRIAELKGGPQPTDYGLGAQVETLTKAFNKACNDPENPPDASCDPAALDTETIGEVTVVKGEMGKHKVSCLRNAGATAPYGHNGRFATLWEIVHFYNTRDVAGAGWDAPEVPDTVNSDELGDLKLNTAEEVAIAAFIRTLTDQ